MELLTRKNGIWITVIGITIFLLNFLTYTFWGIDIDILGAMIFILGIVIIIACGKSMKRSSRWLTRRNGVWICIISEAILIVTAYLPFINGDFWGIANSLIFMLGIILIAVRWNH